MKKKNRQHVIVDSIREIVFGLEDALVSTLGAVTGIAVGAGSTYVVILSGLVLIAAESTSMAAGSYLSSKTAAEAKQTLDGTSPKKGAAHERPVRAGIVMWFFYFIGGFPPLLPYFVLPVKDALLPSVLLTAITLYLVGAWSATYTKRSRFKSGMEMVIVSLAAALIGYVIGRVVSGYFGVDVVA